MASKKNNPELSLMATSIGQNVLIVEDEFIVANDLEIILNRAKYKVIGIASSVQEALIFINRQKPDIVILDIMLQGPQTGIELAKILTGMVIPFVYLSANSNPGTLEEAKATHPYGFLVKPFREKDVLITLQIALYRHAHSLETLIRKEQSLKIALYDIFSQSGDWKQKMQELNQLFQPFIPHDYFFAGLSNDQDIFPMLGVSQIGREEYQHISVTELSQLSGLTIGEQSLLFAEFLLVPSGVYQGSDFGPLKSSNKFVNLISMTLRFGATLVYQLKLSHGLIFLISFFNRQSEGFNLAHLALLERLKEPLMLTIDRRIAFEEIDKLRKRLEEENHLLQEEVKSTMEYGEIVGASKSLGEVFKKIEQVSAIDTSILVLGESGTGKELVAKSIHNRSPRKNKIMVKVNCAALPPNLIESELFGHEKGAFTGAIEKRIGKFELANGGTIFLDEIGEMPLELQAKLLRVLQEKEIERLGGKGPIEVDVRIIAATNRDLEKEVSEGRFRLDLYYRLNVFPILLPALRDRKEDIPLLADFFGKKMCRKVGKPFGGMDERAMVELLQYQWPGNIRELENVIEQAAIVSDGLGLLNLGRPLINKTIEPEVQQGNTASGVPKNLSEIKQLQRQTEREHILTVLKNANGRIRGKNGAAEMLNLKPTTLESRMEKLGISRSNI